MNYLLAAIFQPEKKRVHPPEAAYFTEPHQRARFGRLKRRNMKQSGTPSSGISIEVTKSWSNGVLLGILAIIALVLYSIILWEE
ncbi:MAG TPA: hypothetical protein VGI25_07995 [Candidatus Udaeobacter sp.]|jgi:hypothetical protein